MSDAALVIGLNGEVVVNFGVFAGREVTPAEVDRLGDLLLGKLKSFEIVSERRVGFALDHRAELHRVLVQLQDGAAPEHVLPLVEAWAQDCLRERQAVQP